MFTEEEMKGVLKLQANYFSNSYIKNNGNGTFTLSPLPQASQYACLNGMLAEDFDGDGNLDVLAVGNDYGTEVFVGRYDACNGLFLKGDGKGNFSKTSILQSGWFVPGNAKALVKLKSGNDKCLVIASQNKDKLKVYELKKKDTYVPVQTSDASAMVYYKNGTRQKRELNYGASFLSQSGRFLNVDSTVQQIVISDYKGNSRILTY
jgi:ribosomal protein L30E